MKESDKGPVEILCKEIGFRFDRQMETPNLLIAFVSMLVVEVGKIYDWQKHIAEIPGVTSKPPSDDAGEVLSRTCEMLNELGRDALILHAAEVHAFIHQVEGPEDGPCDHLIDMLSSCVSAIRFGLEEPCHSRHAAAAASHIWRKKYGVTLEDDCTPAWQQDWACRQLQNAILRLALSATEEGVAIAYGPLVKGSK